MPVRQSRKEMADALNRSEYVAALCHRRNGWLVDFDLTRFFATNEAEAKQNATRWADSVAAAVGGMTEGPASSAPGWQGHLFAGV